MTEGIWACVCVYVLKSMGMCVFISHTNTYSSRAEHFVCTVCIFCVLCVRRTQFIYLFFCIVLLLLRCVLHVLRFLTQWFFIAFRNVLFFYSLLVMLLLLLDRNESVCIYLCDDAAQTCCEYRKQIKNRMAARWWRCHCWCIEYILSVHVKRPNSQCISLHNVCLCLYLLSITYTYTYTDLCSSHPVNTGICMYIFVCMWWWWYFFCVVGWNSHLLSHTFTSIHNKIHYSNRIE